MDESDAVSQYTPPPYDGKNRWGTPRRGGGGRGGGGGTCLCGALFGPFFMLYGVFSREPVITAKRWSTQPWEQADCKVLDFGAIYSGSCWHDGDDKLCSDSYSDLCSGEEGFTAYEKRVSHPVAGDNEELTAGGRRLRCYDEYLNWAHVAFQDASTGQEVRACAYRYGIGDMEDLDTSKFNIVDSPVGSIVKCQYVANTCIVAMKNVTELVDSRRSYAAWSFTAMWFILPCTVLCWLGLCFACCSLCYKSCMAEPEVRESAFLEGKAADHMHRIDYFAKELELPPGHWTSWSAEQVDDAAQRLFVYYDQDKSGYLDVNEMVQIMGDMGIHDRHLVLRTMVQLDADESGLIEEEEFGDLCRQIFWSGRQELVMREFARQQEIMGSQAVSATGLAKNRPLVVLEFILLLAALVLMAWVVYRYGDRACDQRFARYLYGVIILIVLQMLLLLVIVCARVSRHKMLLQGAMIILNVFVVAYAIAGTVMELNSSVCDVKLRRWALGAVMILWTVGLYVVISGIMGFVAAFGALRNGTSLSSLSLDADPDSDSEYEEVDVE